MATIRDLAREAGLSTGTVSNVLNNLQTVSGENREKVLAAIKKLDYKKNRTAYQLRSKTSFTLGLVIPDIANPFYPEIARGLEDAASRQGYSLFLCNKDRSVEQERVVLDALVSQNVAGIVLYKPQLPAQEIEKVRSSCALVLIDMAPDAFNCDSINVDDAQGIRMALRHIAEMDHRRIAFISGSEDAYSSTIRMRTYIDTMKELGLPILDGYLQKGDYSLYSGRRAVESMMSLPQPPTAIMSANDIMAIGAMLRAAEMGLSIPADLSIVGYDDSQAVQYAKPELSTVWHPKYEIGQAATDLLLRRIAANRSGQPLPKQYILLHPHFVRRETLTTPRSSKLQSR